MRGLGEKIPLLLDLVPKEAHRAGHHPLDPRPNSAPSHRVEGLNEWKVGRLFGVAVPDG